MWQVRCSCAGEGIQMFYAILCYNNEAETTSWSKEKEAAVMSKLHAVQD